MPGSASDAVEIVLSEEIEALVDFYDRTEAYLDDRPASDLFEPRPSVSDWSPAQHLYHIWRANASMLKAARVLAGGGVDAEAPRLTDAGRRVLQNGHLPRGTAEAPDAVRPPASLDREALREAVHRSRKKLDDVAAEAEAVRAAPGGLEHPAWGRLTARQWLRAARIHSEHHETIVRDILDAASG